jgi:hypothetical protein
MKPSIGRIVIVSDFQIHNGSDEHPAVINRVWGTNDPADERGSSVCINTTVLPDCGAPYNATSVQLFETKDEAKSSGSVRVAWWPERT